MVDAKAKQREQEERKRKRENESFGAVFKEAREDLRQQNEISYYTSGYTKDAKSYEYNMKMRDYR